MDDPMRTIVAKTCGGLAGGWVTARARRAIGGIPGTLAGAVAGIFVAALVAELVEEALRPGESSVE
jgi:hypothetical protein